MALAYYISGHGYGHARRSAEVIRRLVQQEPGLTVHIRTNAPAFIFDPLPQHRITLEPAALDPGAIEDDALHVSRKKTLAAVRATLDRAESLLGREIEFLHQADIRGIVADIPFLAGELARRTGLPAIGCTNFTWDWIYEPWLQETARDRDLLATISGHYSHFSALLRMPFGGVSGVFPEVHDTPLVAWPSDLSPKAVLARLPARARADAPRILVGMRGGCPPQTLQRAVAAMPDVTFLVTEGPAVAENVVPVKLGTGLAFGDVLSVCEGVISKLGYGLVADCAAMGVGIIWPPRHGFREDSAMVPEAEKVARLTRIEVEDYLSGNWTGAVRGLLASPRKPPVPPDGGPWCARFILGRL
ncbi:MAG: hypothetical protein ABSH20_02710 [Tepidisphaeraceae bacterium]|jgi:hypothetical protein